MFMDAPFVLCVLFLVHPVLLDLLQWNTEELQVFGARKSYKNDTWRSANLEDSILAQFTLFLLFVV